MDSSSAVAVSIAERIEWLKNASTITRLSSSAKDTGLAKLLAVLNDESLSSDFTERVNEASVCTSPTRAFLILAPLMHPIPPTVTSIETRCEAEALAGAALWRFLPDTAVVRNRAIGWFLEYATMRARLLERLPHVHDPGCVVSAADKQVYVNEIKLASSLLRGNRLTSKDRARQIAHLAASERLLSVSKHAFSHGRYTLKDATIPESARRALTHTEALVALAPYAAKRTDAECDIIIDLFGVHRDHSPREQIIEAFCSIIMSP
jgi:hypothetical protein